MTVSWQIENGSRIMVVMTAVVMTVSWQIENGSRTMAIDFHNELIQQTAGRGLLCLALFVLMASPINEANLMCW